MMDANDNPPAFAHGNPEQGGHPGMSLLDYFAAQALAGLLARAEGSLSNTPALAYRYAEAMIKTREKRK